MCALLIDSARADRRDHSTVSVFAAASAATVVPHEPAPMTATLIDMALSVRSPVRDGGPLGCRQDELLLVGQPGQHVVHVVVPGHARVHLLPGALGEEPPVLEDLVEQLG